MTDILFTPGQDTKWRTQLAAYVQQLRVTVAADQYAPLQGGTAKIGDIDRENWGKQAAVTQQFCSVTPALLDTTYGQKIREQWSTINQWWDKFDGLGVGNMPPKLPVPAELNPLPPLPPGVLPNLDQATSLVSTIAFAALALGGLYLVVTMKRGK